jgi:hypothetical protein
MNANFCKPCAIDMETKERQLKQITGEILQGKEDHQNYKCTHIHPIEILGMTNSITFII